MFRSQPSSHAGSHKKNVTRIARPRMRITTRGADVPTDSSGLQSRSTMLPLSVRDEQFSVITLLSEPNIPISQPTSPTEMSPPTPIAQTAFVSLAQSAVPTPKQSVSTGAAIAGVVVGGVFALVVFLCMIIACCLVYRRSKRLTQERNNLSIAEASYPDEHGGHLLAHYGSRGSQPAQNARGGHHSGAAMETTSGGTSGGISGSHSGTGGGA